MPLRKHLLIACFWMLVFAGCGRSKTESTPPEPQILRPTVVLESLADDLRLTADPVQTALSPDGSRVVAVVPTFRGDRLVTWDARSGSILSEWDLPKSYYMSRKQYALQCSADARIVCCRTPEISILDTQRQQEIANLGSGIVAVSHDGRTVATVREESRGEILLVSSETGAETGRLRVLSDFEVRGRQTSITGLWFAPNGKTLVVQCGKYSGFIEVWDLETLSRASRLWGNPTAKVAFSADGQRMATQGEQTIRVWGTAQWKELYCLDRSEYLPTDMAFSADGSSLWHHREGNAVYLWDVGSASPIGAVQLVSDESIDPESDSPQQPNQHVIASQLTLSHQGSALVTKDGFVTKDKASYQFWAAIYDLDVQAAKKTSQTLLSDATTERPESLMANISYPRMSSSSAAVAIRHSEGIAMAPDSKQIAVFGGKDILVMESSESRNRRSLEYPKDRFHLGRSPAWSPTGDLLSTLGKGSGHARTIIQWDAVTGESIFFDLDLAATWEPQPWSDAQDVLTCLTYSPDGRVLAAGNQAGNIILIDSGSGEVLRMLEGSGRNLPLQQLVFVDNGAAIVGYGFEVLRWELSESETPNKPSVLFKPAGDGFMMSAGGERGASVVGRDTEIVVQEVRTGNVIASWKPRLEAIDGIHLSADGTVLAVWPGLRRDSESGQIHIHHLREEQTDVVLQHPKPRYWDQHAETLSVCFADHNQRIITCDTLAIRVWRNEAADPRDGGTNVKRKGTNGH